MADVAVYDDGESLTVRCAHAVISSSGGKAIRPPDVSNISVCICCGENDPSLNDRNRDIKLSEALDPVERPAALALLMISVCTIPIVIGDALAPGERH
jgi:hypothetical protein